MPKVGDICSFTVVIAVADDVFSKISVFCFHINFLYYFSFLYFLLHLIKHEPDGVTILWSVCLSTLLSLEKEKEFGVSLENGDSVTMAKTSYLRCNTGW